MRAISVVRRLLFGMGSAMGGLRPKTRVLTVKWGWCVCIIAYNDNGCVTVRPALVQDRGWRRWLYALSALAFFIILRKIRVTLSPHDLSPRFSFMFSFLFYLILYYFFGLTLCKTSSCLFTDIIIQSDWMAVFIGFYLIFCYTMIYFNTNILIFCIMMWLFLRT